MMAEESFARIETKYMLSVAQERFIENELRKQGFVWMDFGDSTVQSLYGDLVMCEGGEPVRCAIWKDEIPDMKIQKALHRIRPHDGVDVYWLYYWFLACGQRHLLDRFFIETTIKHLPGDRLKDIELDLPPYKEQKSTII